MKKVILIILSTFFGAILVLGGGAFGTYMYDISIPHFDNYDIISVSSGDMDRDELKAWQAENGYGVHYPDFYYVNNCTEDLVDCYTEVQLAMSDYAFYIARHYNNRARLDSEVEYTKTRLTVKFTGFGVLEDGTREELARTYIFDIENAGRNKLPKLLNKADIFPEINC